MMFFFLGMLLIMMGLDPFNLEADPRPINFKIVVGMTTIPSRIELIEPTLASLLVGQTTPLDELYIVLPRKKWVVQKGEPIKYSIPKFLETLLQTDHRVFLLRPEYDYGPVDKLLYPLKIVSHQDEESATTTSNLIYLDDDVIYGPDVIHRLVLKGMEYPDSVVAFSGCTLRSNFRQVAHQFPRTLYDQHPNLYFQTSGTDSLLEDEIVDIVQGFMGVLVRPHFFDWDEFNSFVQNVTLHHDEWMSDDFITSGYLEYRNVTKRIVLGGNPLTVNEKAAETDNVSRHMSHYVTQTAFGLQSRLGIWQNYTFLDYISMTPYQKSLMDCEGALGIAGTEECDKVDSKHVENVTRVLDDHVL